MAAKHDCLNNLVPADELESTDDTNDHFLRPKPSYVSISGSPDKVKGKEPLFVKFTSGINFTLGSPNIGEKGIKPDYAGDTDISGNARPGIDYLYSIGAHEMEIQFV
jgi:hypothetical protein